MKTIKEWLSELPEPYRTQALNNTHSENLEKEFDCARTALLNAFSWFGTEQGHDYWSEFYYTL